MKKVLIVDDSPRVRQRIAALLNESPQIRIAGEAGSGSEALQVVENVRPDTVILDIRLPDQNGITLLKRFKARYPEMTVIMLTNLDDPRYRQVCRNLGADDFLSKAMEFEKIVDTVTHHPAHRNQRSRPRKEDIMETFNNILVVSRSTRHCIKVLRTGIALARKFDARLHVLHIIHDPFNVNGWNLPVPSLDKEYKAMVARARTELDKMIHKEKAEGMVINEWVKDGDPVKAIAQAVESENVDLILMLAHREGRLEHFLFGKTNDAIIRRLPASLMLIG
jgi:YesN/AraC family two-component response regulator